MTVFFRPLLVSLLTLPLLACSASAADDSAAVKKRFTERFPERNVVSVNATPLNGIYEVVMQGRQIVYTDTRTDFIFVGDMVDVKKRQSLTEQRMNELSKVDWKALPLDLAVKEVRGNGSRALAVFSDPDCPYCKKLEQDSLAKLDNVTIYTFLLPILSPDSLEKSNQIWCASDKGKAWNDWMRENKAPTNKGNCDVTAIQKTMELGRRLNITGTPTIFFSNGERVPGAVPATVIEQKITQIATQAAASK